MSFFFYLYKSVSKCVWRIVYGELWILDQMLLLVFVNIGIYTKSIILPTNFWEKNTKIFPFKKVLKRYSKSLFTFISYFFNFLIIIKQNQLIVKNKIKVKYIYKKHQFFCWLVITIINFLLFKRVFFFFFFSFFRTFSEEN